MSPFLVIPSCLLASLWCIAQKQPHPSFFLREHCPGRPPWSHTRASHNEGEYSLEERSLESEDTLEVRGLRGFLNPTGLWERKKSMSWDWSSIEPSVEIMLLESCKQFLSHWRASCPEIFLERSWEAIVRKESWVNRRLVWESRERVVKKAVNDSVCVIENQSILNQIWREHWKKKTKMISSQKIWF